MSESPPSRDDLASLYLDALEFTPYPVQEEALLAWFSSETGVLVCAPTGTGKTLIAEAAVFEALHARQTIYYTTPLIALTEQKFRELQAAAERWGFSRDEIGLVTGNRRVNPDARVLVVVAEILLNRLLQAEAFDFNDVAAVVMDEFHSFSDPERGIVWEFSLSLLPPHVRLLLLSATIGNAAPFIGWLHKCHGRRLELVQSSERRVPLTYQWVPDKLLNEQLEEMAAGDPADRRTPALVFCFNRQECWTVAEQMKGKALLSGDQQQQLLTQLDQHDWSHGAGPKLKQILRRGVGVHHAGLLPKYRRIVEDLFQHKLLSIAVCTETLAAGINLPARSVVLPSLLKGPSGKQKLIDASTAHQICGRAGRPQYDDRGFVFALPHEDDVKILRWKEKYDQIPEDTKDPGLLRAKKSLKKKMPTRKSNRQYWNEDQFNKLRAAPPGDLVSRGPLPWRLLAWMLELSPEIDRVRTLAHKRLMDPQRIEAGEKQLDRMLLTLHAADCVRLEPEPPPPTPPEEAAPQESEPPASRPTLLGRELQAALDESRGVEKRREAGPGKTAEPTPRYRPERAYPLRRLEQLFVFRSINPIYGMFLTRQLGIADRAERLQALESVLDLPGSVLRYVRVPHYERMPPGPLAVERLDAEIVTRGLVSAADLYPQFDPDVPFEERKYAPKLAEKLRMLFDSEYPGVGNFRTNAVWAAGDLFEFNDEFNKYVSGRDLSKQEGIIFRHLLRLILLCGEFAQLAPLDCDPFAWQDEMREIADRLTASCRGVDPASTEQALEHAGEPDPFLVEKRVSATS